MLVLINSYENNRYHDSYFFDVLVDTVKGTMYKHMTHTTAMAGYEKPESTPYSDLDDATKSIVDAIIDVATKEAIKDFDRPMKGDRITVVKGRKFPKGETYTVEGFSEYRDRFGRAHTFYLNLTNGDRIDENNVVIEPRFGDENFDAVRSEMVSWGFIKYTYEFARVV